MILKNILITGLSGFWGEFFASYLDEQDQYEKIIGIDSIPPKKKFKRVQFRTWNPIDESILKILEEEQIDAVCHLNFIPVKYHDEKMFQRNVLGAMNLLSACARMKIKKVLLKSSFVVYGAHEGHPNFITESSPKKKGRFAYQENNDLLEIDDYTTDFLSVHQGIQLAVLRFCSVIGPTVNTPMTKYLSYPMVPGLMGFDPLFQFLHETEVIRALAHTLESDFRGVVNIAPSDVLPLSKVHRLCGQRKIPILHPLAYSLSHLMDNIKQAKIRLLEVDFLRYNCILDTRVMENELGFLPEKTGEEAVREFAAHRKQQKLFPPLTQLKEIEERTRNQVRFGLSKLKDGVEDQVERFLQYRQIPTKEQLDEISQKIDTISQRLDHLS